MDAIELPDPAPLPDLPVPLRWDAGTLEGKEQERLHRLAVLHDACPLCAGSPGDPTRRQWLAELADPLPLDPDDLRPGMWLTPEGERASFVHGVFRVHDREAFERWAGATFVSVGAAFAYVVTVGGSPWTRALFWFEADSELHLETASLDRYFHLESVFEHVWPPVFRGSRGAGPLDDQLDRPYRSSWPPPPAEASVFTGLRRL